MRNMDITGGRGGYPEPHLGTALIADSLEELQALKDRFGKDASLFSWRDGEHACQGSETYWETPGGGLSYEDFADDSAEEQWFLPGTDSPEYASHGPWADPDDYDPEDAEEAAEAAQIRKNRAALKKELERLDPADGGAYKIAPCDDLTAEPAYVLERMDPVSYSYDTKNYALGVWILGPLSSAAITWDEVNEAYEPSTISVFFDEGEEEEFSWLLGEKEAEAKKKGRTHMRVFLSTQDVPDDAAEEVEEKKRHCRRMANYLQDKRGYSSGDAFTPKGRGNMVNPGHDCFMVTKKL